MKRILSYLLIVCFILAPIKSFSVNANESQSQMDKNFLLEEQDVEIGLALSEREKIERIMSRILYSIKDEKEYYGMGNVDFSRVTIGKQIPSYEIVDGELLETDVMIFPILHNNDMVAQFFVCKIEETDEWYVQLDSNLVEQTLENVESDQFCYIYDDEGVYTFSNEEVNLVGKETSKEENKVINNRDNITEVSSVVLQETTLAESGSFLLISTELEGSNNAELYGAVTPELSAYVNVPIIKQPSGTNICWAIAMASIINCVKGTSYSYSTVNYVCNGGVDEGVTTNQMVTWFNTHYGMNYAKGSANPNPSTIVNELLAGYPSHGRFTRTVNGVTNSHAVVIRGCNTSANTFSVMNPTPTTSGYTTGNILSGNVYRFISAYSSSTYTLADRSYRYGL